MQITSRLFYFTCLLVFTFRCFLLFLFHERIVFLTTYMNLMVRDVFYDKSSGEDALRVLLWSRNHGTWSLGFPASQAVVVAASSIMHLEHQLLAVRRSKICSLVVHWGISRRVQDEMLYYILEEGEQVCPRSWKRIVFACAALPTTGVDRI